ncbi:MAG TPA: TonB-dependent receptor, partial [Nitrospirae bacterium]|nr:TonB-dependent receptor [Nitrospirota bacterium]
MSKTGNPERGELTSYLFIALFFILNSLFFSTSVSAQSEEEMKILRMYFKEEELVIAPTRALKPLSQVAENMSIVTAKEIEAMNAHTVAEVLERVTGMFVEFFGHDFGSDASLLIQGSGPRHVLVLVDGMPWNLMVEGKAVTNSIPVRIIQRIEIIKGPASSSWGSSLGGVINIVTKDTGNNSKPTGSMSASFGEKSTQDYTAEVSGKAGSVGYYLYAGRQDSDGLRNNRYFERDSVYTKINMPVSSDIQFMLTAGYSKLHINYGDLPSYDLTSTGITRAFFTTASVTAELTEDISFEASFYTFKQKFIQNNNELSTGDQYLDAVYDEETIGGSGKFIWRDDIQTAVVGVDISDGNLDQTLRAGQSLQSWRVPETSRSDPGIEKWAVFANDTITIGRFSITPGIRHDHNNVSGDFTSPSLGAVYKLGKHTVLRVSVAKGFTSPPLSFTSGGGLFLDPNPDLKPERVWSYQAGVESWAAEYLRVKATF